MCDSRHMIDYIICRKIVCPPCLGSHIQRVNLVVLRPLSQPCLHGSSHITTASGDQNLLFSPALFTFFCVFCNGFLFCAALCCFAFVRFRLFFCFVQFAGSTFNHTVVHEHGSNCAKKTFQIHPWSQMFDIFAIQSCFVRNLQFISSIDLCPPGQPRCHIIGTIFLTLCYQIILIPQCRPRSYDTHFSFEDIKNLWQFIQTGFAQKFSYLCDVLLRILQHMCRHILRCINPHGTEFVNLEETPVDADTLLLK